MAYLDRQRASQIMAQADIDGLILFSPESFVYATGTTPGVATMWRRAGAVAVLIPADTTVPEMAVVSDLFALNFKRSSHISDVRESPIWVETADLEKTHAGQNATEILQSGLHREGRTKGFTRPTTFDSSVCFNHLADALNERWPNGVKIGFEATAVSVCDFPALKSALSNVDLIDATEVLARLKMVKSVAEIGNLRKAVGIAEKGIRAVQDAIVVGVTRDQLAVIWNEAIKSHPHNTDLTGAWEYISVGQNPWFGNANAQAGDLIKVDVGCLVDGYTSDTGRTFVLGKPTELQSSIHNALMEGFIAGSSLIGPGVSLAEVHQVTLDTIRAAGFPDFTRGHFGHGLGAGLGSEEWPFISADATSVFEPGMVMAFECPWYITGLGGLIIENQVLITDTGCETMNTLPLELIEIGN